MGSSEVRDEGPSNGSFQQIRRAILRRRGRHYREQMQFRAKQIAPPKEWGTFEDLCHVLFKRLWRDPFAQKNGRRGQAQHGVDVFGSPNGDRRCYWGVQCKGKDVNYGSKAKWSEVLAEIEKAETFSPRLEKWFFATTAPIDAPLQQAARELSIERMASGKFSVDVLGWEEIQALMDEEPEVIREFYPEHADHMPQVMEAVRVLPKLIGDLATLAERVKAPESSSPQDYALWESVTFDGDRGLGPALMGHSLGPSDAAACPRLPEVESVLAHLKIAYSARLIGEPGAGKSICSYQVAQELTAKGFEVRLLPDPGAASAALEPLPNKRCLYLIEDAHLMNPQALRQIEMQAGPTRLVLSNHNAVNGAAHRGAIALDAKRAVKTIAAELRADFPKTLAAVRLADDRVGERMMDTDLGERLDEAENAADRPWQFCFVLGGGWRRSRQAADSARAANADLVLAAVAIRQLASRDARAIPDEIVSVCECANIGVGVVEKALGWLGEQRLILSPADCRTPHQRFAAVVLNRILEGQDKDGRQKVARMIEGVLRDPQYPFAGLHILMHELRFGGHYVWTRLLQQSEVNAAVARCWEAQGPEREFAALALANLWAFVEGGATAVVGPYEARLSNWLSNPMDGAYGFSRLLNDLANENMDLAQRAVAAADPPAISSAYSSAYPDNAYGLANLLGRIAFVNVEAFNSGVRATLDRDRLRELARHQEFLDKPFIFAYFCASVAYWDIELALDMAELFIPTAQKVLAKNPVEGFQNFSHGLIFLSLIGMYARKSELTRRQRLIRRRMCDTLVASKVAEQISAIRQRYFQSAAFFLDFLSQSAPRKFEAVVRKLDWEKLDTAIGDDWADLSNESVLLLDMLCSRPRIRHLVEKFVAERADRIVQFPPRLMVLMPEIGFAHVVKGGALRLLEHGHLSWDFGGRALAFIEENRPELVKQIVHPIIDEVASKIASYNRSSTGPADGFVRIVIRHAPVALREALAKLDLESVEKNMIECLRGDEDHRRTAANVVELAVDLDSPVGDMARRLRARFPKASIAPTDKPCFERQRRRSRQRRKR